MFRNVIDGEAATEIAGPFSKPGGCVFENPNEGWPPLTKTVGCRLQLNRRLLQLKFRPFGPFTWSTIKMQKPRSWQGPFGLASFCLAVPLLAWPEIFS